MNFQFPISKICFFSKFRGFARWKQSNLLPAQTRLEILGFGTWKFQRFSKKNAGMVLLVVIVLMSAIFAISLGIFRVVFGELLITGEISDSAFAFYSADEGIERTIYRDRVQEAVLCPPPGTGNPCYTETATPAQSGGCYDLEMSKTPSGPLILTRVAVTGEYRCGTDAVRVVKRAFDLAYWGVAPVFSPTGGTITQSGGYTIHTFTSSGTFTPNRAGNVEVLVVAGGGGGGGDGGGGGGGGGMVFNSSFAVTAQDYSVTVGAGGNGNPGSLQGLNGADSIFDSIIAIGGGGGGSAGPQSGKSGGSGGGARASGSVGTGTAGQGNNGGLGVTSAGGGGGGAGAVGGNASGTTDGGNGGAGSMYSISGFPVTYGGGGGGGSDGGSIGGAGGAGGGGAGGYWGGAPGVCPVAGTSNTGGGGGGGSNSCNLLGKFGANGGSGIIIIRYLTP